MTRRLTFVLALALALTPAWLSAAPGSCGQSSAAATAAPAQSSPAGHDHDAMLAAAQTATHDHAAAAPTSTPSEIDQLLAQIDQATGDTKVALMATLLRRLVAERQVATLTTAHGTPPPATGGHDAMCAMCAAHKAAQTTAAAESHANHGGSAPSATTPAKPCPMMAAKK